jgi:hypothetical protein
MKEIQSLCLDVRLESQGKFELGNGIADQG